MTGKRKISRLAGLLYMIVVVTGMFSLAYVPKQLFVWNDPSATFRNISSNETLFRYSIASSVICYLTFLFLPVVLYKLLQSVHKLYASVMALLAIVSVPLSFINLQNKYAILSLINTAKHTGAQGLDALQKQTMLYLEQYNNGIFIATIFWGLWLLPFGYLVFKSGFLPRVFGLLLMLGCFGYLINFFGITLSAGYGELGIRKYLGLLPAIGEIGTCLWLLLVGARENKQ